MPVFACQHITFACWRLHAQHVAIGITNGACMSLQCTKLPRQYGGCCMGLQCAKLPRQYGGC